IKSISYFLYNKTGVIAQDLIDKYPELVHMDNDGYYMVDGMNSWKLVKAIQEQQARLFRGVKARTNQPKLTAFTIASLA
ncbi:MAG: hypothetical protein AABX34_03145, partial [Nanoarchaeota archaeon]